MRALAFFLVGFSLIVLQGTVHRFLVPLSELTLAPFGVSTPLHGMTPSLVLPLVVYLGVHEESMARGAILSFSLGWALDILGGGPAFLFRFTMVAIWWTYRAASSRVSTQSTMMRVPLAFSASVIESAILLTLLAIFGADNRRPLELLSLVLPRGISTAVFAPLLFSLSHRLSLENWGAASPPTAQRSK
jgi:cell shape-determining protein MreD